jgi:hypothetical protein
LAIAIKRLRLAGMKRRIVLTAACAALLATCGCAGPDHAVILYEGADRPGGEDIEGPPPPGDYKFGPTEAVTKRVTDTNGDKRGDRIEYLTNGEVVGTAEDTNYDGKIDVYRRMVHGKVVDETRDKNFDGILDERRRDTNADGTLDLTEPLTP